MKNLVDQIHEKLIISKNIKNPKANHLDVLFMENNTIKFPTEIKIKYDYGEGSSLSYKKKLQYFYLDQNSGKKYPDYVFCGDNDEEIIRIQFKELEDLFDRELNIKTLAPDGMAEVEWCDK